MSFLPTNPAEIACPPDFIIITGDAYVCHPSFGAAVIGRLLEGRGYSVGIIAQPNWRTTEDFTRFGAPRLAFLVTGGNIDSMVNHYTVALHKRKADAYSPGGQVGLRPNRATIVYCNKIREAYKDAAIIIGGLEASLRRMAHYDYWDDTVRRSILLDSAADLLVYGMGERATIEIAETLDSGIAARDISFVAGTVFRAKVTDIVHSPFTLPPFREISQNTATGKAAYAKSFMSQLTITNSPLVEEYPTCYIIQNPPAAPLSQQELDDIYALPFMREAHPMYHAQGGVPAIEEVQFSITATRGCFGGCSFCALNFHQGRHVQARSHESVLAEATALTKHPRFKGYIHDVGGPTANFRQPPCATPCNKRNCLSPSPCAKLKASHGEFIRLLRQLRKIPRVKKVFIRSGIRYDYLLHDPHGGSFLKELCAHHISGRLKVAPEHICDKVLHLMNKPGFDAYEKFAAAFDKTNASLNKQQFLVPYLMSSHPGCNMDDAIRMAEYLHANNIKPDQVQDFYPTPGTISTCMYYTGRDPRTGKRVFVAKSAREKATQRALIQYRLPQNYDIVKNALLRAARKELIGHDPRALIRPKKSKQVKK
jgi:uncharacterized radical SAM protein YgiQ